MPLIPGVSHLRAVQALEKAGFQIRRQSNHIIIDNDFTTAIIPRHNPIKPATMGNIVRKAGLTVEQFRELL